MLQCADHVSSAESSLGNSRQYCQAVRIRPDSLLFLLTLPRVLYDFYKQQNALHASSIHATYLVYGTRRDAPLVQSQDGTIKSSFPDSDSGYVPPGTPTLSLVPEERLDDVLQEYQQLSSIHVYSLAPHPQKDVAAIADLSDSLTEYNRDPLSINKYGAIINPDVRKRQKTARPAVAVPKAASKKEPIIRGPAPLDRAKQEAQGNTSRNQRPAATSVKSAAPAPKRGGIMQSFARAANAPSRPKPAAKTDDVEMTMSDDGGADESYAPARRETTAAQPSGKSRKEREEELRRMMEEDQAEEESQDDSEDPDEEMEAAPESEAKAEPEFAESKPATDAESTEVVASCSNGRRRGRRRIMRKKRIQDDKGYLVTIQEPGWESFSEDEIQPMPKKTLPTPSVTADSKTKKAPVKGGQGNIMSFFTRK
ncbi:hypothetical protein CDD82_7128 [Ophiocordyceps australis]|uniref:DNA polymerase delta subunit 3 n=1 Tax=Ophiocordyceps australis TaxID=1399860 RepID=A0A2C5ZR44_9HYPO|nr:hypothetical protein CDD82_7128 [Ophiocordyceps australis]